MSIECAECERDLRGGHDESCSRHPLNREIAQLRRQLDLLIGQAANPPVILTDDARALVDSKQAELDRFRRIFGPLFWRRRPLDDTGGGDAG